MPTDESQVSILGRMVFKLKAPSMRTATIAKRLDLVAVDDVFYLHGDDRKKRPESRKVLRTHRMSWALERQIERHRDAEHREAQDALRHAADDPRAGDARDARFAGR